MYTGDFRIFRHATGQKIEAATAARIRDFSRNAFTVSFAAGCALSPDDSFQTTVGVLLFQTNEQLKRGPYGARNLMHPEVWAEHAAEMLLISGGNERGATAEKFFDAKAGIWKRALATGYTSEESIFGEKRTVRIDGLWTRYRNALPDYTLDQQDVCDLERRAELKKHPNFLKTIERGYRVSRERFAEIVTGRMGNADQTKAFLKSLDYSDDEIAAAAKAKK